MIEMVIIFLSILTEQVSNGIYSIMNKPFYYCDVTYFRSLPSEHFTTRCTILHEWSSKYYFYQHYPKARLNSL